VRTGSLSSLGINFCKKLKKNITLVVLHIFLIIW